MMKTSTKSILTAALLGSVAMTSAGHTQEQPHDEPAIANTPADGSEPSLDDLLGLTDGEDNPDNAGDQNPQDPDSQDNDEPDATDPADHVDPELTRALERRLTGQEASQQFEQAIDEMQEVAIRLGDEADPGIDTQRMQDQIILKLEQIISSAEAKPSKQSQPKDGKPKQGPPRQADRGGQQGQQGQQQGQKPGEQQGQQGQQGQQANGQQDGQQPGEQQGQDGQQGQQGDQAGQQANKQDPNGKESGNNARRGDVRNAELSMKDLREGEWGNLPPRLRDELAESLSETFNPVYRAATEAFYRRIAELSEQDAEERE